MAQHGMAFFVTALDCDCLASLRTVRTSSYMFVYLSFGREGGERKQETKEEIY